MLVGGRNSLLESAQRATLTSLATSAFLRQCGRIADARDIQVLTRKSAENNGVGKSRELFIDDF
jgi:hypothetical protein